MFNGVDSYFEVPDNDDYEVIRTGILTIEAWVRPDVDNFSKVDISPEGNYVHWMGKGTSSGSAGNQLWAARIYNNEPSARSGRISGYVFNLSGGLGAGSYFDGPFSPGAWIHYTLVINTKDTSSPYPLGYTKLYKDGMQIVQTGKGDNLSNPPKWTVIPGKGNAPTRFGTRNLTSFFQGAMGKVAFYDYELPASKVLDHNNYMRGL